MNAKAKVAIHNMLSNHRMLLFLASILVLLTFFAFVHEWYSHYLALVEIFFTLILIGGIYLISRDPQLLTISALIALLFSTIMWFNIFIESVPLLITGLVLQILFFCITTHTIVSHVMTYQKVSADTIYGAISAYLLLCIIWAMIYTTLEIALPESFKFSQSFIHNNAFLASHRFYFSQFIYFSFVTITTLGYGDIVPLSIAARSISALEAITGQLYVAVLIARLVGLQISHTHWERVKKESKLK